MRRLRFFLFSFLLCFSYSLISPSEIKAYPGGENLTLDYFIQSPDYTLTFWYSDNGNSTQFVVNWEPVAWNKYKKTCVYSDGVFDFSYYLTNYDTVFETNSGWAIPQSEWNEYPVTHGSNAVFKSVAAGTGWSNQYITKDGWGNVQKGYSSITFQGLEDIEIQGHFVPAAKLNWSSECLSLYEAPNAAWGSTSYSSRGIDWYVRGLGIVKRNFIDKDDNVTSGFTLTNIWDGKRFKTVSIEEWQPVSIAVNGVLQGYDAATYEGNVLVPVRNIFNYFQRPFSWDQATKVLTVDTPSGAVTLALGTKFSENKLQGSILILPAPAIIRNGKLMVPVEFVDEILELDYHWDKAKRLLEIYPSKLDSIK